MKYSEKIKKLFNSWIEQASNFHLGAKELSNVIDSIPEHDRYTIKAELLRFHGLHRSALTLYCYALEFYLKSAVIRRQHDYTSLINIAIQEFGADAYYQVKKPNKKTSEINKEVKGIGHDLYQLAVEIKLPLLEREKELLKWASLFIAKFRYPGNFETLKEHISERNSIPDARYSLDEIEQVITKIEAYIDDYCGAFNECHDPR